jgi:hypothetical protein
VRPKSKRVFFFLKVLDTCVCVADSYGTAYTQISFRQRKFVKQVSGSTKTTVLHLRWLWLQGQRVGTLFLIDGLRVKCSYIFCRRTNVWNICKTSLLEVNQWQRNPSLTLKSDEKYGWTKTKTGNIHLPWSLFIRYRCLVRIQLL